MLEIILGARCDFDWAQETVTNHHYLRRSVDPRARPMAYVIRHNDQRLGCLIAGIPHASRCRGWWGYPSTITQWQVVDLNRIWVDPALQRGGCLARPGIVPGFTDRSGVFRPTVATWAINQVLARIQRDRVALWPPVYPEQPYHIRLVISYHDPRFHKGTIYHEAKALPMYADEHGQPVPGPSGKYGWAWRLPQPVWTWRDLEDLRPRNMRLF